MTAINELLMREYRCRYCDAPLHEPCKSKSGRVLSYSHADRYYQARRAGVFPRTGRHHA